MYSFSKIPLNEEIARTIVDAQFGSDGLLQSFVELKEGYYNAAGLIELTDGRKFVLKAAPPDNVRVMRYERDIMRAEVESMQRVYECTLVPVPEIVAYDTSRRLLNSDYFIMSFLPGVPFHKLRSEISTEAQAKVEYQMGKLANEINQLKNPSFGYWSQHEDPGTSWKECFANMLRGVLLDGQEMDVKLPLSYDELYQKLEAHFEVLDEVRTPRLVHWDLWDGNVFVDPESFAITGLIDFERAMWGDPLIEAFFGHMDPNSPHVQGYGLPLLSTPNQQRRRLLYNAYLFLIMVIEVYYRRYETQDQENWARERLNETLAQL